MLLKWLFNSTVDPLHSFSQKQSGQGFENVNHLISCPAQNPSKLSCQTWFWLLAPSPASYPSSSSETQIRQSSLLPQTIFFFCLECFPLDFHHFFMHVFAKRPSLIILLGKKSTSESLSLVSAGLASQFLLMFATAFYTYLMSGSQQDRM